MYILYKVKPNAIGTPVDSKIQQLVEKSWLVGYISSENESTVDFSNLNYIQLTDDEGRDGWKFYQRSMGYLSLKVGTTLSEGKFAQSRESADRKQRYDFTDADWILGASFQKKAMKFVLERMYEDRVEGRVDCAGEVASLSDRKTFIETKLNEANTIAELNLVGHNYMGMYAGSDQMEQLSLSTPTNIL